jgi:sulfite oxidase
MNPPNRLIHDEDGLNSGAWPVPVEALVTPTEFFFTRSHAAIPTIDAGTWRLEVGGLVDTPKSWSLEELVAGFPKREVVATLVCAGMRRNEFLALGPLPGELPWGPEPASTGVWEGVALCDVLEAAGLKETASHVEFVGLDQVERHGDVFGFGGSIDIEKAMSADVLLATALNGEPLTPQHGFPLRAVVPGWIGARSVKWLGKILARESPSRNYFQESAYRVQRQADPANPRDVTAGDELGAVPLNAVILEPLDADVVPAGLVHIRGWAIGSGGADVTQMEVSCDEGRTWTEGRLTARGTEWTWSLWEASVHLDPGTHTVIARASDAAGAEQPRTVEETWNVKGYVNNAWHRITLRSE